MLERILDFRTLGLISTGRSALVFLALAFLVGCDSPEERAQSHFERGIQLVEQNELAKAKLEFRNALKLKEGFVPVLFALGKLERRQSRHEQAARLFAGVVERAPEHVDARVELARILLLAGQFGKALKYADQAYVLASSNPDVLVLKAAIALKLGNSGDAIRFANAALEADPHDAEALIVLAAERLAASDPNGALSYLDKGTEKHGRDIGLHLFRMKSLAALKDNAGIEKIFKTLIGHYPTNEKFRYGLARWYLRTGKRDEAEQVIRQFVEDNPDDVQIGLQLITFLKREKGIEAARSELESRISNGANVFAYKMALAELTFGQGNTDRAVELLKSLIAETKGAVNIARVRILLAGMMVSKNELQQAEEQIASVLSEDPKNAKALTVRASIHVARENYARAIEDLSSALNESPESPRVLQLLAQVYELNGSVELARDHHAKAAKLEQFRPGTTMNFVQFLLRYGKSKQAERVLTEMRGVAPGNKDVLKLLGQLRLARQDWLGAHEIAEVLRKLKDGERTADLILAEALSGQQRHDESIKLLQASLPDANDQNSPIASLVRAYVRAKQPGAAEEFLRNILASNPDNLSALLLLGSLHEFNNQDDQAESSFRAAVQKHPKSALAHRALAEFHLRNSQLDDAEAAVRDGLKQNTNNTTLRLLLALIFEQSGRYDEAIAEYETMMKVDPRSTIVANNLASLLAEHRSDHASIERAYSLAVRFRDSRVPQFLDTLGWVHYRKGEYDEAIRFLTTAAEKLPRAGLVQYHLGMTYDKLGRSKQAIGSLEKALELSKEQGFPERELARSTLDKLQSETNADK